jgi:8-oxo-dGTP pyrophosphatase MutT (NUDIX family)
VNPEEVLAALRRGLARPLPGTAAQAAMSPGYPSCADLGEVGDAGCREASVLVLFYPAGGEARFPLILRPDSGGAHAGQISLPGGSRETGETAEDAALRETEEELGVPASSVEIIGALSETYVPTSRFVIRPFVGWTGERPAYSPSPSEVSRLFEPSVGELLDPELRLSEERVIGGKRRAIPFFRFGAGEVWGATARILAELAAVLAAV